MDNKKYSQSVENEYEIVTLDAYDLEGNVVRSYTSVLQDTGKGFVVEESILNIGDSSEKNKELLEKGLIKKGLKIKKK